MRDSKPRRSYLDTAAQIAALLDAAGELDRGPLGIPATVTSTGARCSPRSRSPGCDSASCWRSAGVTLTLPPAGCGSLDAKTAAGVRDVHLLPVLRDELLALKARSAPAARRARVRHHDRQADRRQQPPAPGAHARRSSSPTSGCTELGGAPLPSGLTPHSLRRTFATVLYAIGTTPPVVMAEMGHTTRSWRSRSTRRR